MDTWRRTSKPHIAVNKRKSGTDYVSSTPKYYRPAAGEEEEVCSISDEDIVDKPGKEGADLLSFPFNIQGKSITTAGENLARAGSIVGRSFSNCRFPIGIKQRSFDRLSPGTMLDGDLILFWLMWIFHREDLKDDFAFVNSYFIASLRDNGVPQYLKDGGTTDILNKKMILLPINEDMHWTLLVVINPMLAFKNSTKSGSGIDRKEQPFMIHLDSIAGAHDGAKYHSLILDWLNLEVGKNAVAGNGEVVISAKSMPLFTPDVPQQDGGVDCGVYVCMFAYHLYYSRHTKFEFHGNLSSRNSAALMADWFPFPFDEQEICDLRIEMRQLLDNLLALYLSSKETNTGRPSAYCARDSRIRNRGRKPAPQVTFGTAHSFNEKKSATGSARSTATTSNTFPTLESKQDMTKKKPATKQGVEDKVSSCPINPNAFIGSDIDESDTKISRALFEEEASSNEPPPSLNTVEESGQESLRSAAQMFQSNFFRFESSCETTDYGPSFEHTKEENDKTLTWKDLKVTKKNFFVTFNDAKNESLRQLKVEVAHVRETLARKIKTNTQPTKEDVFKLFFSKESLIIDSLMKRTERSYEDVLHFIATAFVAASLRCSTRELYDENSFVDTNELQVRETNLDMWKAIADNSISRDNKRSKTNNWFWKKFQQSCNDTLEALFLEDYPLDAKESIVIDDHKEHFEIGRGLSSSGLKVQQHVRDNTRGVVCHHSAWSATGILVGFVWEPKHMTTSEVIIKLVVDPRNLTYLNSLYLRMDRGYWFLGVLNDLMAKGINLLGTVKRTQWVPFVYGMKLHQDDPRTDIPLSGGRTQFVKETEISKKSLAVHAYKDPSNGVTLALSTEHSNLMIWDLVSKNPENKLWYLVESTGIESDERKMNRKLRGFRNIDTAKYAQVGGDESSDIIVRDLLTQKVRMLTTGCEGNHHEWFLERILSITSSTSDRCIRALTKLPDLSTLNLQDMSSLKLILQYANISFDYEILDEEETGQAESIKQENDDGEEMTLAQVVKVDVDSILSAVTEEVDQAKKRVQGHLDSSEIEYLKLLTAELMNKPSNESDVGDKRKVALYKKTIKTFLEAEDPHRYICWRVEELKEELRGRRLKKGGTRSDLMARLIESDRCPGDINIANSNFEKILDVILESSFMPELSAKGKEYAKLGHAAEIPLATQFLSHSKQGKTAGFDVESVWRLGLAQSLGKKYVEGTMDFLCIGSPPGETILQPIGIETKARVANSTEQKEQRRQTRIHFDKGQTIDNDCIAASHTEASIRYSRILYSDEKFHNYVESSHEAIQCLHHAYLYDLTFVLLLIGDRNGTVESGIFIEFAPEIKKAYGQVLKVVYDLGLSWAYTKNIQDDDWPRKEIESSLERIKSKVAYDSFETHFLMKQYIHEKMQFPLPPIDLILPWVCSRWNNDKGGSDTMTKMMRRMVMVPPTNDLQARVVGKSLMMVGCSVHRLFQLPPSDRDLDGYKTINHYREQANKRQSYGDTLKDIARIALAIRNQSLGGDSAHSKSPPNKQIPPILLSNCPELQSSRLSICASKRTGATPTQSKERQKLLLQTPSKNTNYKEIIIQARHKLCTGHHRHLCDSNGTRARGICDVCGNTTQSYCVGCHNFLCSNSSSPTLNTILASEDQEQQDKRYAYYPNAKAGSSTKNKHLIWHRSCFVIKHEEAEQEYFTRSNNGREMYCHGYENPGDYLNALDAHILKTKKQRKPKAD